MLLIALCGSIGSGKSSVLVELAERLIIRGKQVEGFLQRAGDRPEVGQGARGYELLRFPRMETVPWAERDEALSPPYRFDGDTQVQLERWSAGLGPESVQVAILDEFGRLEVEGGGHLHVWTRLAQISVPIVILGVRDENVAAVAERLGQPFDLVLDVSEPHVVARLEALCVDARDWESIGAYGAGAGALEVSLGTAIHAANVPMGGLGMATLQSIVLTAAAEGLAKRDRVGWVAMVAAGLKALSPGGSRLRPMLAISVQGVLYATAVRVLGWNRPAVFVGGALIGAWAAGQGLVLQWLLVGSDFFRAYDAAVGWIAGALHVASPGLPVLLVALVLVSALVTGSITAATWNGRHRRLQGLARSAYRRPDASPMSPRRALLYELMHPAFWLPLAIVLALLALAGTHWTDILTTALRAIAIGLVLFGAVRYFRMERLGGFLRRTGRYGPAIAIGRAFRK